MAQHVAALQGKAAVHAVNNKMEDLLAPLLKEDDDASASSNEDSAYSGASSKTSVLSVKVKQTATEMMKTAVAYLVLSVGAAASVGAMIIAPATAVFIMGGVCVAHAPYAAYKEYNVTKLPSLRILNNKLREDANQLEEDVDILSATIDDLQPEADRAVEAEEELSGIAGLQHCNVNKFIGLVKENRSILNQMRFNLRQRIVQDVFSIVMSSDKNNDGKFCKVETKMLVLKISLQLQTYGVEFDEEKFYKVMSVDPSVARTLQVVKRLIPNLSEDDGNVDSGEGSDDEYDDAFDMFHMASDSSATGSLTMSGDGRRASNPMNMSLSLDRPMKNSVGRRMSRAAPVRESPDGYQRTLGVSTPKPSSKREGVRDFFMKGPSEGREKTFKGTTGSQGRKRDFFKKLVPK